MNLPFKVIPVINEYGTNRIEARIKVITSKLQVLRKNTKAKIYFRKKFVRNQCHFKGAMP